MTLTDGELLERWRGGDAASGEELFERYYDIVDRFFLNKVPTGVVPDLVQETFAGCVAGAERIKNHEQFRFYLFGIACNVLKAHIRQGYRGGQPLDFNESSMRDLAPGPVTLLVQRREHRLLLEALRCIPAEDQIALELYYWEKLSTDELARVLGIPAGTARGRLQRAREKLGQVMHRLIESRQDLSTTVARLDDWAQDCRDHLERLRGRK